ncbi:MAG: hypothetical protein IJ304_06365 [Clostridia bacterium]|nr:hypothetical protein [Clostridia bacterium]
MKKLMALLLAVSALAMSTSAFAYDAFDLNPIGTAVSSDHKGVSRNYTTSSSSGTVTTNGVSTSGLNYGTPVFRATSYGIAYLPTYRAGDSITFALVAKTNGTVTKVNEGDVLTYICSKQDDTTYENTNVQFIDQVTLTPSSSTSYIYNTYKLRDTLEDGRYKLEMRLHDKVNDVVISNTYSFLIGTPSVELMYVNDVTDKTPTVEDKYFLRNGDAYCFGKATITGGANFSQVDTDFGFVFDGVYNDDYIKKTERSGNNLTADADGALQASITNGNNQEIGGQAQYFFRMVIEDVYDYTYGVDLTDEEKAAAYAKLPDVDVYLND